jgi:hypothetical protein
VAGLLVLVVAVVCFALFPPSDLLRRAVLPVARSALNHENLHIGDLTLRPLSRIELHDLWLGPPAGYSKPMFTVRRIVVRHDISQVMSGLIRVEQVQIERPFITVEARDGKLNWIAFLEGLPKGEEKPEEEEPEGEPSRMRIVIDRVAVIGFGADVDDGVHQATLDSLHLAVWGLITPERKDAHVSIRLEPPAPGKPSLSALVPAPQPGQKTKKLGGKLDTTLAVDVRATVRPSLRSDLRPDIKATVALDLDVASKELIAPWPVPRVALSTRVRAEADTLADRARVNQLTLRFNETELLRLSAALDGVFKPRKAKLLLSRLDLPLELFLPYVRAVDDSVDVGGRVAVRDLKVDAELSGKKLPRLSGLVAVEKLSAAVKRKGLQARLRDLDVRLALATRAGGKAPSSSAILRALPSLERDAPDPAALGATGPAPPSVMVHGRISLGEARGQGAVVRGLDLRLASAAHLEGLSGLGPFGSALRLRIPKVSYGHPKLGPIVLGVRTDLRARGDWRRRRVALERLVVDLPELVRLQLSARAEELGKRGLSLDLKLRPAPLKRLIARLPRGVRRQLGPARVVGDLDVGLKVTGRLPEAVLAGEPLSPRRALGLPLRLDARVGLHGIGVRDSARKLSLTGLGGAITCKGRPSDLRLETDLAIKTVSKTDLKAVVQGLRLPIKVHFTPRQLQARLGFTARQLFKGDLGLSTRGLALGLDVTTALAPLHRLLGRGPPPLGRTRVVLTHGVDDFRVAVPATTLITGPIRNRVELTYAPGSARNTRLAFESRIKSLNQVEQRARLQGLSVDGQLSAAVPVRALMRGKPGQVGRATGQIKVALARLSAAPPGNTVRGRDVGVTVDIDHDPARPDAARADVSLRLGTLDHDQQQVRVRGLTLDEKTRVEGVVLRLPEPVIKLNKVHNQVSLRVASLHKRGVRSFKDTTLEVSAEMTRELQDLALSRMALRVPSTGVRLDVSGRAGGLLSVKPGGLPTFDIKVDAGLENPVARRYGRATALLPGLRVAGKAGAKLRLRHPGAKRVTVDARLLATAFNLWSARGAVARERDGSSIKTVTRLHLRDLDMDVPISQTVTLGPRSRVTLPRPRRSIFDQSSASDGVLYSTLRPYQGRRTELSLGGVLVNQIFTAKDPQGKVISTVRRQTNLDRMGLNLSIDQSTLLLNRLYLKLFSGDIAGSVQAQLLGLNPVGPPDVRGKVRLQVTGVNLAYLDPKAKERTAETEVSALVELEAEPCRRHVKAQINITHLSLKMLDSLLAFLDPNGVNEDVQKNRKLINSTLVKLASPKVKLVSIWINYGNLNMDIDIDALEPFGALIRSNLRRNRIRRLDILWLLDKYYRCRSAKKETP